jgi:hypothetical protein
LFGRRREFPIPEKLNGIYNKIVYKLRTKIYLSPFSFFPTLGTRLPVGLSCSELMQKQSCDTWIEDQFDTEIL